MCFLFVTSIRALGGIFILIFDLAFRCDSSVRCTCPAVRRAAGSAVPSFEGGLATYPPYNAVLVDKDSRGRHLHAQRRPNAVCCGAN